MGNYIDELRDGKYIDTNYYDYWNQCRKLNYAAEENFLLFLESMNNVYSVRTELLQGGFFNASLLLRAVAIENLIKARVLFIMKEDGTLSNYSSISKLIKKEWKIGKEDISHNPIRLCEKYGIKLSDNEKELIENHLDHMLWAGRFPFPKRVEDIKSEQSLGGSQKEDMNKLILRFTNEMKLDFDKI